MLGDRDLFCVSDPFKFIASKGDGTGAHINVECYNCRVDFN